MAHLFSISYSSYYNEIWYFVKCAQPDFLNNFTAKFELESKK